MNLEKTDFENFFEVNFLWKFSFLKIYVMGSTQVDLLDIVHAKVGFFAALKMCIRAHLGKFVWSTLFVQCGELSIALTGSVIVQCKLYARSKKIDIIFSKCQRT